jgi:hypothetical protein
MIYWKSGKFWLGRLREYPDIMTQGRTLKPCTIAIEDLLLITECSRPDEWEGQVHYLPLR